MLWARQSSRVKKKKRQLKIAKVKSFSSEKFVAIHFVRMAASEKKRVQTPTKYEKQTESTSNARSMSSKAAAAMATLE